jgi:hypothetical protein
MSITYVPIEARNIRSSFALPEPSPLHNRLDDHIVAWIKPIHIPTHVTPYVIAKQPISPAPLPPNGLPISRAALLDRQSNRAENNLQNASDLGAA